MTTPDGIFQNHIGPRTHDPEFQAAMDAVYRFDLSGPDGGTWIADFKPATAGVRQSDEEAQCKVSMSSENFLSMVAGNLNPRTAFLTGKIKVAGEITLALKLNRIFAK